MCGEGLCENGFELKIMINYLITLCTKKDFVRMGLNEISTDIHSKERIPKIDFYV